MAAARGSGNVARPWVAPRVTRGAKRGSVRMGLLARAIASATASSQPAGADTMPVMTSRPSVRASLPVPAADRDTQVREALRRVRILVNRTPHLTRAARGEANRAIDALESQVGLNRVNVAEAVRAIELLNRAHSSLAFSLLRDPGFVDRFSAALRQLGLRGIGQRLDEISHSVMAEPIPGPTGQRVHRDDLSPEERTDQFGNPLPPPPGFYGV